MERKFFPIADIIVEDRMRDLDPGWVEALADDIAEKGQLQPIGVRKTDAGMALVFGEHRLAAHKLLGKPDIEINVLPVNAAQAKVVEIDENILRMPFAPLAFARALAKRKAVYEEAYPLSKNGAKGLIAANTPDGAENNPPECKNSTLVEVTSFSEDTAGRLGVSKSKVFKAIWLHKHFDPLAEIILKGHAIMDNASQLHALAKLDPREQEQVATLIADGTYDKVADAEAHISGAVKPTPSEKIFSKMVENWARADMGGKRSFLDQLSGSDLPAGYKIITPERVNG